MSINQIMFLFIFTISFKCGMPIALFNLPSRIDDSSYTIQVVNSLNNAKIYPRLQSLLVKDYFRFYKVNLKRKCPFWSDDSHCTIKYCQVETCDAQNIPPGLKTRELQGKQEENNDKNCEDYNRELGYLDPTISERKQEGFLLWTNFDDSLDTFCVIDHNEDEKEYFDLLLNPERYTGYRGKSACRIWNSIYKENCFLAHIKPNEIEGQSKSFLESHILKDMCLEKRVFYRIISGLHASINVHLCSNYLKPTPTKNPLFSTLEWGPNSQEFLKRFSPNSTNGEGPKWLHNLYFVYLLELRALAKASSYLRGEKYFTGNKEEDDDTQKAVKDFLGVLKDLRNSFNETALFASEETKKLKLEFRKHFQNISLIMDCVGCDKCKLWGKLQTQGLGTALKILFSKAFNNGFSKRSVQGVERGDYQLERSEIVSLFNSIGRLSTSIFKLNEFRELDKVGIL